jgi:hypothetical protein
MRTIIIFSAALFAAATLTAGGGAGRGARGHRLKGG